MKILQLNIQAGMYLGKIVDFLKTRDYDILCFQEVGGGDFFKLKKIYEDVDLEKDRFPSGDCFKELEGVLDGYSGILNKTLHDTDKRHYLGDACFVRKGLEIVNQKAIDMNAKRIVKGGDRDPRTWPVSVLWVEVEISGKPLHILSGRFLWNSRPFDTNENIEAARKVYDYIKDLDGEFILAGDLNVHSNTITVSQFDKLGLNISKVLGIQNTLDPKLHSRGRKLFPEGVACDQIIVSAGIGVYGFNVVREGLSDHYGLDVEFEFESRDIAPIGGLGI